MALITTEYSEKVCQCCGADTTTEAGCVCGMFPEWRLNEHGDASCGYPDHLVSLYTATQKKTVALGVKPIESNDRWRNFR